MAGIKTLPRRPSLPAVSTPSVRTKKTTTASKPRPLTHIEARAKQLAEKAVEVVTRAAKGNGKTGSATGGYRPTPPPTEPQRPDLPGVGACGPTLLPGLHTGTEPGELIPTKGNTGAAGRATVTKASYTQCEGADATKPVLA